MNPRPPAPVPTPAAPAVRNSRAPAIVATAGLTIAALAAGWGVGRLTSGPARPDAATGTAAAAADERRHAGLVALKSEAEALAVAGKLEAAHAKYRELTARAAADPPASPLMWDIMERAKTDQDRIYWIMLARMDKSEAAFGPGAPPLPNLPGPANTPMARAAAAAAASRPGGSTVADEGLWSGSSDAVAATLPGEPPPATIPATTDAGAIDPRSDPTGGGTAAKAPASGGGGVGGNATGSDGAGGSATAPTASAAATAPASQPALPVARVGGVALAALPQELAADNPALLDMGIDRAINQGAAYLLAQFKDGELPADGPGYEMHRRGLHALVAYALLTGGQAVSNPRLKATDPDMVRLVERLKAYPMDTPPRGGPVQPVVYARSLRAAALGVRNRREDRAVLKQDVDWLVAAHLNGAYTYDDRQVRRPNDIPPGSGPGINPVNPGGRPGGSPRPGQPVPRRASSMALPPAAPGDRAGLAQGPFLPDDELAGPLVDAAGRPVVLADGGTHRPVTGRGGGGVPGGAGMPPPQVQLPPPRVDMVRPGYGTDGGNIAWDNSNSQYGVLGVWAGAEAGLPVPPSYWNDVLTHWTSCDLPTGEWPYKGTDKVGTYGMTAGGAATLLTVHEWQDQAGLTGTYLARRPPDELVRALGWLEQGANAVTVPGKGTKYVGYDLFALGRVGALTGYKYFGSHDWYRELAAKVVRWQFPNGAWGQRPDGKAETVIETAYHVLFLARGRHPVMMNKLRYPGNWNNRPRDLANATAFVGRSIERPLNWQAVNLERAGTDWLDSPVLYVAGDDTPRLTPDHLGKIRDYVQSGGLLFLHADSGSWAFNKWAKEVCGKLFPDYPLEDLPSDHELYKALHKLPAAKLKLRGVSNGSRLLALFAPDDLANAWQRRAERTDAEAYKILGNLWVYVHGKTNPRPRLDVYDIPNPPAAPAVKVPVARLRYAGNWDPEPGAWPRFTRYLHWETGAGTDVRPVATADLKPGSAALAHLTGTADYAPTPAEAAAVRAYVEAGGVLLVDACGGSPTFLSAVEAKLLPAAFPGLALEPRTFADAPVAQTFDVTDDLSQAEPRPFVVERLGPGAGGLRVGRFGKGHVVVSPLDLSTGLAGSKAWGVLGYSPDFSVGVVKNLLVWAATRTVE